MSAQSFYLPQLNVDIDSASAILSAGADSEMLSGNATADVSVTLSTFKSLFQFQTDSTDINDVVADDVKFRSVYATSETPLGLDINSSALVAVNPIDATAANAVNHITHDYTRYLAQQLFNTHLGVDLFDNEVELRDTLNDEFKINLDQKLVDVAADGVTTQSGTSPSKTIFNQIIKNTPERFANLMPYALPALVDGAQWYYMPGMVGDKFYFVLTVSAAEGQNSLTGVSAIVDRTYLIRATIVA